MKIVKLNRRHLRAISDICADSFLEGEYSYYLQKCNLKGLDAFIDFCSPKNLETKMTSEYIFEGILDENTLVGVSCLNINSGKILLLFVTSEYKKQGYGKMLLDNIIETAKTKKLKKLTVDATHFAKEFYSKNNFLPIYDELMLDDGIIFTPMELKL